VPFAAPKSEIMALRPYWLSQELNGARFVDANCSQSEWLPEKSTSRYSWMSKAGDREPLILKEEV
jgi:hypothetical protein